ncbi:DUF397 domain-containing protein [Streptomyces sioyaensis]|uniref:DUF397 domain-containing protein n=1 Tax=Streptomyces sioyaensis TaxID=67364 RepID=UPI0037D1C27D
MTESPRWAKSSYSNNGGACIEWAPEHAAATGEFLVRDSKDPHGPALAFPAPQWNHFVEYAKGQSI